MKNEQENETDSTIAEMASFIDGSQSQIRLYNQKRQNCNSNEDMMDLSGIMDWKCRVRITVESIKFAYVQITFVNIWTYLFSPTPTMCK